MYATSIIAIIIITQPRKLILIYHPTEGRRLS